MSKLGKTVNSHNGVSVYNPLILKIYNLLVLNISNSWIWRCPKRYQLQHFQHNLTDNHLDIGVGTGFYLKQCKWPTLTQIALMDLNPFCLATARKAIQHLYPTTYLANIYQRQEELTERFSSISMNYLIHCLPGTMESKKLALANAVAMLQPYGILFGATILSDSFLHTNLSSGLMAFYNKKCIFSNNKDTLQLLRTVLSQYLDDIDIKVIGCVALFKGYKFLNRSY